MDYQAFDMLLIKKLVIALTLCIVGLIVGIYGTIYFARKLKCHHKTLKIIDSVEYYNSWVAVVLGVFIIVACSVYGGICTYRTLHDVNKNAYIVYEGVFYVDVYDNKTVQLVNLPDGTKLESSKWKSSGYCTGKLVYGEKTTTVVYDDSEPGGYFPLK